VSALVAKGAISWILVVATILYLPGLFFAAAPVMRAVIVVVWLSMGAFGVLVSQGIFPVRSAHSASWLVWLAAGVAVLFFAGLLGAAGLLVSLLANMPSLTAPAGDELGPFAYYIRGVLGASIVSLLGIALGFGILYAVVRRFVDLNLFSLDALDSARLTRTYVAASRPMREWENRWSHPRDQRVSSGAPSLAGTGHGPPLTLRDPEPLTGLDPGDDVALGDLCIGRNRDGDRAYWGPHLLFNTTQHPAVDAASGAPFPAGESFVMSPLYCGSQSAGYTLVENPKPRDGMDRLLSLGRAIALSGAGNHCCAGFQAPGPLAALLTLSSFRPGSWLEKPTSYEWAAGTPRPGELPVWCSMGFACGAGDHMYLSSGADFEPLGVYELIRRRCRYVVAVDGSDRGGSIERRLDRLVERCRVDFGLRIEIKNVSLQTADIEPHASTYNAIGLIHYEDADRGATPGVLLYAGLSMAGDEFERPAQSARNDLPSNGRTPRSVRPPGDRLFEFHRIAGSQSAAAVFGGAVARVSERFSDLARLNHMEYVRRLFDAVMERWGGIATPECERFSSAADARTGASGRAADGARGRHGERRDARSGTREGDDSSEG
jgi:hypothetical protein